MLGKPILEIHKRQGLREEIALRLVAAQIAQEPIAFGSFNAFCHHAEAKVCSILVMEVTSWSSGLLAASGITKARSIFTQ